MKAIHHIINKELINMYVSYYMRYLLVNLVNDMPNNLRSLSSDPGVGEVVTMDVSHLDICKPADRWVSTSHSLV